MKRLSCVLLLLPIIAGAQSQQPTTPHTQTSQQQTPATSEQQPPPALASPNQTLLLEAGTPVRLRIARTVSSANAHVGDRVDLEVLEEVRIGETLVVPKGGIAWATVTVAQRKRRLGRAGKLSLNIDSVRLVSGEKAALRAVREEHGGSNAGKMTGAIVATSILFFPAAPLFLLMSGKDLTVPKGTEITAYVNGDTPIDVAKFQKALQLGKVDPAGDTKLVAEAAEPAFATAHLDITSTPEGAEILLNGKFVGNAPSSIGVTPGEHTITVKKVGFRPWERKITVTSGRIKVAAELESGITPPGANL